MLDQHAEEALEAAQDGAVQHHRRVAGAVLADVFGVEPLRQDEVELQRAALPGAADRVAQQELELGAVEGALAGIQRVVDAGGGAGLLQRVLGVVPDRVGAEAQRRAVGELDGELRKPRSR